MPFPNLTRATGRTNVSQATGAPDNGNNTFLHNWDIPADKINADAIDIDIDALGSSVSAASFVGLSADSLSLIINFTQTGADTCRVTARHVHSIGR